MDKKPTKRKNALGRGLGALLEDSSHEERQRLETEVMALNTINEIPLENIEANPFQPRSNFDQETLQELAESIKIQGIIQPITVRRLTEERFPVNFRRTEAAGFPTGWSGTFTGLYPYCRRSADAGNGTY
jgi:ParB family chromosome partitioning protein